MVCLTPPPSNEHFFGDFTDSIEQIPFTDEDVNELNEILFDDEEIAIQPINLEHVFANEENLLEDVYFPTLTIVQLENLAASAYHDRNPSKLSAVLDPIALDYDVTSDSIKNELIYFHKDMNNGL